MENKQKFKFQSAGNIWEYMGTFHIVLLFSFSDVLPSSAKFPGHSRDIPGTVYLFIASLGEFTFTIGSKSGLPVIKTNLLLKYKEYIYILLTDL